MLEFEPQQITNRPLEKRMVRYWIITFTFNNIQPIEFKVRSLPQFATLSGIPIATLKHIVYNTNYHSKKYADFMKYCQFQAVY